MADQFVLLGLQSGSVTVLRSTTLGVDRSPDAVLLDELAPVRGGLAEHRSAAAVFSGPAAGRDGVAERAGSSGGAGVEVLPSRCAKSFGGSSGP
ncbi:hypothetical protein [Streptomyces sp. NPDC096152]|uniref:hypothetical protein n=1 Tax=Streptomyces sp. NPDC096152 TaxID=3366078 RepID=UPI003815ECF3